MAIGEFLYLLGASVAVWRVSYMLTEEQGPYEIFEEIRTRLFREKWSPLECFYCTSLWVSFIPALFVDHPFMFWLSASGLAILIEKAHQRMEGGI